MKAIKPEMRMDAEGIPSEAKLLVYKLDVGGDLPHAICRNMGDFRHAIEALILAEESDDTLLADFGIPDYS